MQQSVADFTLIFGKSECSCIFGCMCRFLHPPEEQHVFTEICSEFGTSQRTNVGIGPYDEADILLR